MVLSLDLRLPLIGLGELEVCCFLILLSLLVSRGGGSSFLFFSFF